MEQPARVPLTSIYRVFFEIGVFSFGGGLVPWIYREVVEMKKWMSKEDFLPGIALSQVMPGVSSTNCAIYVGQMLRGAPGALTALIAMLTAPFICALGAAWAYKWLLGLTGFQETMIGVAAAAIGMLLRTGIEAARMTTKGVGPAIIIAITFVAVGVLRLPIVPVVAIIGPISVALAWRNAPESTPEPPAKPEADA
ncbi:MAG: chromate transporter [Hyphomicrobiales bacterium]|nr:chromate transporter [Hyphomicrobiales bacterium]